MFEFMEECSAPVLRVSDAAPTQPVVIALAIPAAAASAQPQASPVGDCYAPEGMPSASTDSVLPQAPAGQGEAPGPDNAPAPATPGLTQAWREILAAREEVDRLVSRVRILASGSIGYELELLHGIRVIGDTEDLAKQFREGIFYRASKKFGVEGVELKIEQEPILQALGAKALWYEDTSFSHVRGRLRNLHKEERMRRLLEDFDPDALWHEIERRYGGDAGKDQAYRQVAARLVDGLGLRHRPPVERAGRLVLEVRTCTDAKYGGGYAYSYHSCDHLTELRRQLAQFARWAGDTETADLLQHKKVPQLDSNVPLEPRSKQQFGAMEWTFFKPKIELALSGDLARSFRVFMAKFGPRPATA